jgi:regulator of protease activity HflC (stomatin/prohibitin superfamily)
VARWKRGPDNRGRAGPPSKGCRCRCAVKAQSAPPPLRRSRRRWPRVNVIPEERRVRLAGRDCRSMRHQIRSRSEVCEDAVSGRSSFGQAEEKAEAEAEAREEAEREQAEAAEEAEREQAEAAERVTEAREYARKVAPLARGFNGVLRLYDRNAAYVRNGGSDAVTAASNALAAQEYFSNGAGSMPLAMPPDDLGLGA